MSFALGATANGYDNSSTTDLSTGAFSTAIGQMVVVTVRWDGVNFPTVSDLAGNIYDTLGEYVSGSASMQKFWTIATAAHASNIATATFSPAASYTAITAEAYTVSGGTPEVDGAEVSAAGNGSVQVTGTFGTTIADAIAHVASQISTLSNASHTPATGYTLRNQSGNLIIGIMDRSFSTTQSGLTAGVTTSESADWTLVVTKFGIPGGTPPPPPTAQAGGMLTMMGVG